jgi:hypothetical protein
MEHKVTKEKKQAYSVHFQNAPSHEQVLFLYRNALNDYIHLKVQEHLEDSKSEF